MVKSPSCFKIITCGSDSAEKDDLEGAQGKGSNDKRGWSFRKRSARHRVLNNTVATETPPLGCKEGPESATVNFESQADTTVKEKISVVHCNDEKPKLATYLKPEIPDAVVKEVVPEVFVKEEVSDAAAKKEEPDDVVKEVPETAVKEEPDALVKEVPDATSEELPDTVMKDLPDAVMKEMPDSGMKQDALAAVDKEHGSGADIEVSVVIVIQTAARGFLARRELLKLKKLVKLQAAVRGHIVRRHAVGTLRCVQAIVKMQALVRARRARLSLEGSCQMSDAKEKENFDKKSSGVNTSMEKLLSNRFARQMLESTPKTKPINVKCDSSKPDSAWKWLERWMSASSVNASDSNKIVSLTNAQENEKNVKFDSLLETKIESDIICESVDSKCSSVHESTAPSESEDNLITYEAGKLEYQDCHYTTSSARDNMQQPEFENTSACDAGETSAVTNSFANKDAQPNADSQIEPEHPYGEPEVEAEQPKRSTKRHASDELETEGKRLVSGSKKASNPSFFGAQSTFEELSPAINSSYQEADELHQDVVPFEAESVSRTKEISIVESPVHGLRNQVGGSECGTELSVTSTLDSPDRSDIGAIEPVPEAKILEEGIYNPNNSLKITEYVPAETESSFESPIPEEQEKPDVVNGENVTPAVSVDSLAVEPNPEASYIQRENKSEAHVQAHIAASPEASPRSHMTVPESQGTPSSQVSVKDNKKKSDKSGSGKKRASLSAIKKSPPKAKHDSPSKSSVEKLPKEQKDTKRRNSVGSPKPENGELEPRDSSSSSNNNSLPHFMQATESARAKLNANSSPRSSPDVQDGENYTKKRHSLPGANGHQGSPRIQRSTSQAQQGAKGNERKWQR